MRTAGVSFGWKPAVLVAIAAIAAACGSSDPLTSVSLEIYDSSVIQSPTKVTLDVFDGPGGNQIATLDRTASAQTSASSLAGQRRDRARRQQHRSGRCTSKGGDRAAEPSTSWGSVDVPLIANRQVSARLMLGRDGGPGDAGPAGRQRQRRAASGGLGGSGAARQRRGAAGGRRRRRHHAVPPTPAHLRSTAARRSPATAPPVSRRARAPRASAPTASAATARAIPSVTAATSADRAGRARFSPPAASARRRAAPRRATT